MKFTDKIRMIKNYLPMLKFYFYSLLKKDKPLFGLFFQITNKCNAKCLMCFNWQILNKSEEELSFNQINRFSKTMGTIPNLTIGGGEPFLRDDLPEICRIFCKNNGTRRISIPTNSLLPDKILESSKKILELCPIKIVIVLSLDGVGGVHDLIRGVNGAFDKVLENYKNLKKLSERYPNLQISINTTISDKNEDHISEIIDFVDKNLLVKFHTVEMIRGCYNQKNVQAPSLDKYQKLIKDLLKSESINKDKYHKVMYAYYHRIALDTLKKKKQLIPCRISSFMPVVDAVGKVYNCELLPAVGNLKDSDYDFSKIWHSDKARQQREDINKKKCYCTHYCYQIQNIPISPWHFLKTIFRNKL